ERGYRQRDVARLILEKNLFGLDIDGRAAQLTGFALMMKGRADDRRLFDNPPRLNVMALLESKGLDADELIRSLETVVGRVSSKGVTRPATLGFENDDLFPGTLAQMTLGESSGPETSSDTMSGYAALTRPTIAALIETFAEAKTFGSLIQIAPELVKALPELEGVLSQALETGDAFARAAAEDLLPLVRQARVLAMRFDAVVANPPYMGSRYYCAGLKDLIGTSYEAGKPDLYGVFILRNIRMAAKNGYVGMITIPNWMFLPTFEDLRDAVFNQAPILSLVHNGRGVWGSDFRVSAYNFF
ncbi:Eco57I restriction-modification methylase domain-containing protein, partial [uncultured Thiocystis sp.]|uniref:Eco57I restriction-modification methylase domain-containing protein n=1 Tax=uncultured Thiocystis sp. TaxID=1202134 RepID=UPI0025DB6D68